VSNTIRGSKPPGYEFWSRRPGKGRMSRGAFAKKMTHRTERQQGRVSAEQAAEEYQEELDRIVVTNDDIDDTIHYYKQRGIM